MIRIVPASDTRGVRRLVERRAAANPLLQRRVARIVEAVRRRGDRALLDYARRIDGLAQPLEVTREEIEAAVTRTPPRLRDAIAVAARHIARAAERQLPRAVAFASAPGVRIEQRVTPLGRVGCYVPGGRYPLVSSVLMTAVPARAAGVPEVIVVCPRPEPPVLFAARAAGVARVFRVGGAQAIAALAYGTRSLPRVDRIVGPGNAYVAAAKNRVAADCPIDFQAGPSEIVVISERGPAEWIAADLLAQAEHDPDARAILLTPSRRLAGRVARALAARLPRTGPARAALTRNGGVIVTRDLAEAIRLANAIAPEHLVCPDDDMAVARRIAGQVSAGTVFLGPWSAQAAGDYATGSNHVLPTGGAARFRGGLSAADFVRVSTVQILTRKGLAGLAPHVTALAEAEGLAAHAASIHLRLA